MFVFWMIVLSVICLVFILAALFYLGSERPNWAFFFIALIFGTMSGAIQLISNHFDWAPNLYWTMPVIIGICCLLIAWLFYRTTPEKNK